MAKEYPPRRPPYPFKKYTFHISEGPKSLFSRVKFKIRGVRSVNDTEHSLERFFERFRNRQQLMLSLKEELDNFDFRKWNLVMASVSPVTYRWVDSAWERILDGTEIRVIIGLYHNLLTVMIKDSPTNLSYIVKKGTDLYNKVDTVNRNLRDWNP